MVQGGADRGTFGADTGIQSYLAQALHAPLLCDLHAGVKEELLAQYDHFPMVVVQVGCSALVVCSS